MFAKLVLQLTEEESISFIIPDDEEQFPHDGVDGDQFVVVIEQTDGIRAPLRRASIEQMVSFLKNALKA